MASGTGLRHSQKAARKVLHPDRGALSGSDVIGAMAASTGHTPMFAFESVAGKFVVERFRFPLDERKILPVVLGVATGTLLARSLWDVVGGVQTLVRGDARPAFSVAFNALQG